MAKLITLFYGTISYIIFFITFLYSIGFVGNLIVPKSIDSGSENTTIIFSIIINVILLSIFALQHSIMARPVFKRWWTRFIPAAIERSTYVLLSSLALALLFWFWQPITGVIWSIENPVGKQILNILFWIGWLIVLLSTFMINHFDLFGLRQVYLEFKGKEYTSIGFKTPWLYQYIRHPIMMGFIIAFWATPHMTTGHLLFSVVTTSYILVALQFEEHDLTQYFGEEYKNYKKRVSMIFPMK